MTMFKSKKSNVKVDVNHVVRRKKRPDDVNELVITVHNRTTEAEWWLSTFELFAFLWGWMPELFLRLVKILHSDDGWKYMQIFCTENFILILKDYLEELKKDLENELEKD